MGEATTRLFQVPFDCHSVTLYKAPPHQTDTSPNCGATTALSLGLISPQFADLLTVKGKGMFMSHWRGFMERRGIATGQGKSIPVMKDESTVYPELMTLLRDSLFPQCGTFVLLGSRDGGGGHIFTIVKGFKFAGSAETKWSCKKDASDKLAIFDAQRNRIIPEEDWAGFFRSTGDAFRQHFGMPRGSATTLILGSFVYIEPKTYKQVVSEYVDGLGSALLNKSRISTVTRDDPVIQDAIKMDVDDDREASTLAAAQIVLDSYEETTMGGRSTRRFSLPRRKAGRSSSAKRRRYTRRRRA